MMFKPSISNDVIKLVCAYKTRANEKKGWVASHVYDIVRLEDKKIVGRCDLRFGMNPDLYYSGNIGYAVYPPYRGQRYAAQAVELLFEVAKKAKMQEVIITCNPDNIASIRTCEIAGCTLKEIVDVPANHELIKQGDYQKCIYVKSL